jgi:hypothetical protein
MTTLAALLALGCSATGSTSVADTPPPSAGHALVYHSGLGAVLLVNGGLGGHSSPPSSARTTIWRWTGSEWTVLSDAGPPIRNLGGVAYDARRNRLVMYGGTYSQNLSYDDTWEWDQASGWQQKEVSGPGIRDHVEMVYDATRERVVLYGGQLPGNEFPRDTWTWDGTSWQQLHESGPAGRVHYGLVYDPGTQRTYLFGGSVPASGRSGETWYLAAAGWTPAAPAIDPRSHARLGATSHGVILVGGFPESAATSLQRLMDTGWVSENPAGHPGARYMTAMAYDPVRQVTVLFGGGVGNAVLADTWEYHQSTGWQQKQ